MVVCRQIDCIVFACERVCLRVCVVADVPLLRCCCCFSWSLVDLTTQPVKWPNLGPVGPGLFWLLT